MTWGIRMRLYATSLGAVAQDEPRNGNERTNHWIILRLAYANGLPPGMPPRLGIRSSLYEWRDGKQSKHLLKRCDRHASQYPALGDRNGSSKNGNIREQSQLHGSVFGVLLAIPNTIGTMAGRCLAKAQEPSKNHRESWTRTRRTHADRLRRTI